MFPIQVSWVNKAKQSVLSVKFHLYKACQGLPRWMCVCLCVRIISWFEIMGLAIVIENPGWCDTCFITDSLGSLPSLLQMPHSTKQQDWDLCAWCNIKETNIDTWGIFESKLHKHSFVHILYICMFLCIECDLWVNVIMGKLIIRSSHPTYC